MKDRTRQTLARRRYPIVLATFIALLPAASFAADAEALVVVLRNGESVRGNLLSLTQEDARMVDGTAHTLTFATADVVKLDSSVPYAVETTAGETLKGKVRMRTKRLGRVLYVDAVEPRQLAVSEVVSIAPESAGEDNVARDRDRSDAGADKPSAGSVSAVGKPQIDEDDVHSLFLKHMSVLLVRREMEVDVGLSYMYSRWYDPTQNRLTYARQAQMYLAWSFGLASFLQGAVSAPLVFHQEHAYQYADSREEVSQGFRPGNVTTALSAQVLRGTGAWPSVMIFSDLSIPLGSESASTQDRNERVHLGFWSTSVGISVVKMSDPLSFVVGASYSHAFDKAAGGQSIQLGDFWGYLVGVGFAVNSKVSLSTNFRGGWQAPTRQGGARVVDTEGEPMTLGMGVIYAMAKSWYVSPAVVFPINVDGGSTMLRLPIAHRF